MTFGDWLNTWLELYVAPSKLAPSTIACYNRAVAAVPAALARLDLHDLTPILMQKWIVTVARQHPRAAQLDRVMLVRALRCASKAGLAPGLIPGSRHTAKACPRPQGSRRFGIGRGAPLPGGGENLHLLPAVVLLPVRFTPRGGAGRQVGRCVARWDIIDPAPATANWWALRFPAPQNGP